MSARELFSEEQLDYLEELLNIGAGNATTALNHLLRSEVNMKLPRMEVLPAGRRRSRRFVGMSSRFWSTSASQRSKG